MSVVTFSNSGSGGVGDSSPAVASRFVERDLDELAVSDFCVEVDMVAINGPNNRIDVTR